MSVYESSITDPKKQLEFYKVLSEQLQQENKQLKTTNESLTSLVNSCQKEIRKYKEVIEEIREVINTYKYVENDDGIYEPILDGYDIQKLLQILDKGVKDE
jgi:chromosome segregation ATPase